MIPLICYSLPPALAATGFLTYASVSPTSQFWGAILHQGPADLPRYSLTFDDGPTDGATNLILDILADLNIKAAFFVIGVNVARSPHLLRRIHADGHLIGNHSYHHSHYGLFRGPSYWHHELTATDDLIFQTVGLRPNLFRPPLGFKMLHVTRAARRTHHSIVTWSRRAYDGVSTTSDRILARLASTTSPGEILALHDGIEPNHPRDASPTIAALRPLIQSLASRGLATVRLDDLLNIPAYARA